MFTKKYIEMVTQADEIQKLWKPKKGDYIYSKEDNQICLIYHYCFSKSNKKLIFYEYINNSMHAWDDDEIIKTKHKWLPTLEDLFGILRIDDCETFDIFFKAITNFYWKKISRDYNADSLQEMLLRIVMLNIFHKIWNPDKKEWEEINGS